MKLCQKNKNLQICFAERKDEMSIEKREEQRRRNGREENRTLSLSSSLCVFSAGSASLR
jgi:hypothetical protein